MANLHEMVVNGWVICAHPVFLDQYESLIEAVAWMKAKDPINYKTKNVTKRLAAIQKLVFDVIPQNPSLPEYRLGATLGDEYKHWFRAKFFQQYRLFFRYHQKTKIIVFAWVNDEDTKRSYENKTDAYKTFKKMLANQRPPDDWKALLNEAQQQNARFGSIHEAEARFSISL